MTCFPDVNFWIALIVSEHVHHEAALVWFGGNSFDVVVFSRATQMGVLRLLTTPKVMGRQVMTIDEAWTAFGQICAVGSVVFANDPPAIERTWRSFSVPPGSGSGWWTDAYLAAFAKCTGFTLITFDKGFGRFRDVPVRILG